MVSTTIIIAIVTILISVISLTFTVYINLSNKKKSDNKDSSTQVSQQVEIFCKLETILDGIKSINSKVGTLENDVRDHDRRLLKLEFKNGMDNEQH